MGWEIEQEIDINLVETHKFFPFNTTINDPKICGYIVRFKGDGYFSAYEEINGQALTMCTDIVENLASKKEVVLFSGIWYENDSRINRYKKLWKHKKNYDQFCRLPEIELKRDNKLGYYGMAKVPRDKVRLAINVAVENAFSDILVIMKDMSEVNIQELVDSVGISDCATFDLSKIVECVCSKGGFVFYPADYETEQEYIVFFHKMMYEMIKSLQKATQGENSSIG